jgi:hypothetical protein
MIGLPYTTRAPSGVQVEDQQAMYCYTHESSTRKKRENRSSVNVKSGAGAIETAHGIASRGRFTTLIGRYICNLSEAYSDSHSALDDRNY